MRYIDKYNALTNLHFITSEILLRNDVSCEPKYSYNNISTWWRNSRQKPGGLRCLLLLLSAIKMMSCKGYCVFLEHNCSHSTLSQSTQLNKCKNM